MHERMNDDEDDDDDEDNDDEQKMKRKEDTALHKSGIELQMLNKTD